MKTVAHLSDLHFGCADAGIVDGLVDTIAELAPDVVAISGDLTQRARRRQFIEARAFLARLPQPQVVVPGNHDVPLYNVLARFARPLGGFRRYITSNLCPVHATDGLLVVGANTTRSFTIKDGGLRPRDLTRIVRTLAEAGPEVLKVVVCHHPFDAPSGRVGRLTRPRPDAGAIAALVDAGADLLLTGHLHVSYTGGSATRYHVPGRAAIVVEAGTAASTRVRGEQNSFNLLRLDRTRILIERFAWDASARRFEPEVAQAFSLGESGWTGGTSVEAAPTPSDAPPAG